MAITLKTSARVLFVIALAFTLGFFALRFNALVVDTDIRSLAPAASEKQQVAAVVDNLAATFQKRVLFLITAPDGSEFSASAQDASDSLYDALAEITSVNLLDETQTLQTLEQFITQHRFQLLTPEQQKKLQSKTTDEQLAQQIVQAKYSLAATPQLLPFDVDPLTWYSQYLMALFAQIDNADALPENMAVVSASIGADILSMNSQAGLAAEITKAETAVKQQYPEVDIKHSGIFFYAVAAADDSRTDISRISTVSTLAIVLLLVLVFRSFWALVIPITTVALGVAFAFAVTHLIYGNIHVLTIVFGASLIGVVIDYSLHYFFHQQFNAAKHSEPALHRALLLSVLTSLVGYSALGLSHLAALSQVAVFSCAGMIVALLAVISLCPLVTGRISIHAVPLEYLLAPMRKFASFTGKLPVWLAAIIIALGCTLLVIKPGQDNPALFFKPDPKLMAMDRAISQQVNQFEPGSFVIFSGATSADVYAQMDTFFATVDDSEQLARKQFLSVTDFVPSAAEQNFNYQLQARLYQLEGVAARVYQQLQLPAANVLALGQAYQAAADNRMTPADLLDAAPELLPPLWQAQGSELYNVVLIRQGTDLTAVKSAIAEAGKGVFYRALDETTAALKTHKRSALELLCVAYFIVGVFLIWRYRLPATLGIILPPLCGTALMVVLFAFFHIDINLFHVMAAFLVLGLGLDYGIFVFEMRTEPLLTHQAILLSAFTSLLSFGLLAVSDIPVVQSFGLALVIANSVNFLGSLIFSNAMAVNQ